jgi:ribosomal protein L37AE/L43A
MTLRVGVAIKYGARASTQIRIGISEDPVKSARPQSCVTCSGLVSFS